MIIKRRHQSINTVQQRFDPIMAGSRTYVGAVYYDSQQPVTENRGVTSHGRVDGGLSIVLLDVEGHVVGPLRYTSVGDWVRE